MDNLDLKNYVCVGTVSKPFGHKGEVSLKIKVTLKKKLTNHDFVFFKINASLVPFYIENCIVKGETYGLKLETINSISDAEKYNNREIFLPRSTTKSLSNKKEYGNLIGFELYDAKAGKIGVVEGVLDTKAQPLLQITYQNREVLIPLAEDLIQDIDTENKIITLHIPSGLLDL
ncbi:MAG: 16S rRNA processing protein RimM [Bacteroidetes bacterium]|nr:16S rRNA processing protein RimM [Bacteroidota bacterium]